MLILNDLKWKLTLLKWKIDHLIHWFKPSYGQYLVIMLPEDVPKNEWCEMSCDFLDVKSNGITGRYHKIETFVATARIKVKY